MITRAEDANPDRHRARLYRYIGRNFKTQGGLNIATILTDGNKTAKIVMRTWSDFQWSPDYSNDFFEVGGLKEVDVFGELAYEVDDLNYCIDQARDWAFKRGDFYIDEEHDVDDREVWIQYID